MTTSRRTLLPCFDILNQLLSSLCEYDAAKRVKDRKIGIYRSMQLIQSFTNKFEYNIGIVHKMSILLTEQRQISIAIHLFQQLY